MNIIGIFSIMSVFAVNVFAEEGFTFKKIDDRRQEQKSIRAQAGAIQTQIDQLTKEKNSLATEAEGKTHFSAQELLELVQSSPNTFPNYCKVNFKIENGQLVTTIDSSKENLKLSSAVETASLDTSSIGASDVKIWSYSADLVLLFSKAGTLDKAIVSNGNKYVSCPYEAPFHCPSCE